MLSTYDKFTLFQYFGHGFRPVSFTMPYSTELIANDVKSISFDRQKRDLSKYIYLWYRYFFNCRVAYSSILRT